MKKINKGIALLSGGLKKDFDGLVRSTNTNEVGDCGPPGSILRMLATGYLFRKKPDSIIIVSGGIGTCGDVLSAPECISTVIKRELIDFGVPAERILEEVNSSTTYEQLLEINKLVLRHNLQKVILVSNVWHLDRISAMLYYAPKLDVLKQVASTASAEDIVIEHDVSWKKEVQKYLSSKVLLDIINKEKRGVLQIKDHTYKF